MQELLTTLLNLLGLAWWVEVKTEAPHCTYYFGPFLTAKAATTSKSGYVTDLEQEGAQNITVVIKRCKPSTLTVFEEQVDKSEPGIARAFSSQF